MKKIFSIFFILIVTASACEQAPMTRSYQEVVIDSPLRAMRTQQDPHAGLNLPAQTKLPSQQQTDDPEVAKMLQDSVAEVALTWKTPKGWNEAKGSGMRMATFSTQGADKIECTIVSLGGMAGGLEANVVRWMRQISLEPLSTQELNQFLNAQQAITSAGGYQATLIDLSQLQKTKDGSVPSMMAAIFQIDGKTVFLKMTGSKQAVTANKSKFKELCKSLE